MDYKELENRYQKFYLENLVSNSFLKWLFSQKDISLFRDLKEAVHYYIHEYSKRGSEPKRNTAYFLHERKKQLDKVYSNTLVDKDIKSDLCDLKFLNTKIEDDIFNYLDFNSCIINGNTIIYITPFIFRSDLDKSKISTKYLQDIKNIYTSWKDIFANLVSNPPREYLDSLYNGKDASARRHLTKLHNLRIKDVFRYQMKNMIKEICQYGDIRNGNEKHTVGMYFDEIRESILLSELSVKEHLFDEVWDIMVARNLHSKYDKCFRDHYRNFNIKGGIAK